VVPCLLGIRIVPASKAATRGETDPGEVVSCRQVEPGAPWFVTREDGSVQQAMARPEGCSYLPGEDAPSAIPAAVEASHE
jgi:hypothetical protein